MTAASTPARWAAIPGPGDEDPESIVGGIAGELQGVVGGSMGREHADFDGYAEFT